MLGEGNRFMILQIEKHEKYQVISTKFQHFEAMVPIYSNDSAYKTLHSGKARGRLEAAYRHNM